VTFVKFGTLYGSDTDTLPHYELSDKTFASGMLKSGKTSGTAGVVSWT